MKKKNTASLSLFALGFFLIFGLGDQAYAATPTMGSLLNGETPAPSEPSPTVAADNLIPDAAKAAGYGCNYGVKCCKCYNAERSAMTSMNQESELLCAGGCKPLPGAVYFSYGENLMKTIAQVLIESTIKTPTMSGAQADSVVPGETEGNGIVACGRPGQSMCTLCDLIAGLNNVIQYLMKISIGVALLAMTIGGVMYVVSAGDSGLIDKAKGAIKNASIGFVIIFAAYLIVDTTINYLGTSDGMGIKVTSWGKFECKKGVH